MSAKAPHTTDEREKKKKDEHSQQDLDVQGCRRGRRRGGKKANFSPHKMKFKVSN